MSWPQIFGIFLIGNGVAWGVVYYVKVEPENYYFAIPSILAFIGGGILLKLNVNLKVGDAEVGFQQIKENAIEAESILGRLTIIERDANARNKEFTSNVESTEKALKELKENGEKKVSELDGILNVLSLFIMAEADERSAFEELTKRSNDEKYVYKNACIKFRNQILAKHNPAGLIYSDNISWKVDPQTLTMPQFIGDISKVDQEYKPTFIRYVIGRKDFTKKDKFDFLVEAIKTEKYLSALEWETRYFNQLAGLRYKALIVTELMEWWEKNKDGIKE